MFHACFIPIVTCFVSTLCHFYTFSGTNLLTRCRSASSCFLLFLYSRKASLEIFSELDETSRGMLFCQNTPDGPKEQQRRATRRPHAPRARAPFCCALGWCRPLGGPQPPPFRLPIPPDAKTLNTRAIIHEKFQDAAVVNPSSGGFRSSSRHPAGEGN